MQESRRWSRLELLLLSLMLGLGAPTACARNTAAPPDTPDAPVGVGETGSSCILVEAPQGSAAVANAGPNVRSIEKSRRAPTLSAEAVARATAPLPEGTTVLHVGDSFAGALGIPLNKRLEEAGVRGVLKYRTASYIVEWAHQPDLETYVQQYQPDLVLVTLGANELEIAEPEQRIPAIRKIVSVIGDRPCVWVGVPLWSDQHNGLMEVVRDNVAPCRFMDSAALFPDMPRAHDKIHPTMQAREDWAVRVVEWLAHQRRPTDASAWTLASQ